MCELKDIILIILIISVIYLIYKNITKKEHFDLSSDIKKEIANQYKVDIDAMRNLAQITKKILSDKNNLILPANINIPDTLTVNKDLIIGGNVKFKNINTIDGAFEIFPRYTVIAYANRIFPKGWVLCDGKRYYPEGDEKEFQEISEGILVLNPIETPDLRSRFIIGADLSINIPMSKDGNNKNLTKRIFKTSDGYEEHKLTSNEIPLHNHFYAMAWGSTDSWQNIYNDHKYPDGSSPGQLFLSDHANGFTRSYNNYTSNTGGDQPHNNMPPWYALYYIMKL